VFLLAVLLTIVATPTTPPAPGPETIRIEWSSYCFLGGDRTSGVVRRYRTVDGGFTYENTFRERGGPLPGSFSNADAATFDAIASEIEHERVETMRLRQALILDGCAGHIAITRGSVTTTISEFETDYDDPSYLRFHRILHDLDRIARDAHWNTLSDDKKIEPLIPY
jgi:hypothetical protein